MRVSKVLAEMVFSLEQLHANPALETGELAALILHVASYRRFTFVAIVTSATTVPLILRSYYVII